jgi:hypothetical protein
MLYAKDSHAGAGVDFVEELLMVLLCRSGSFKYLKCACQSGLGLERRIFHLAFEATALLLLSFIDR